MKRIVIVGVAAVVLLVGAVVVYVELIREDAPPELAFREDGATPSPGGAGDGGSTDGTDDPAGEEPVEVDGTWVATEESVVGYRVEERFLGGLDSEAAGRTSAVTGSLVIDGTRVTEAAFTADVTTLESDDPERDAQVQGRILETEEFPEATFALTEPIDLGSVPAAGAEITATATGDLQLHGVTHEVTFEVMAKRTGDQLEVLGTIPVVFADYGIENPSTPVVTTDDHGELEFLLVLGPDGA